MSLKSRVSAASLRGEAASEQITPSIVMFEITDI